MFEFRKVQQILSAKPTLEGAGVFLKRAFGYHEVPLFDPFLLLDDFGSNNPKDYLLGFPWHPHRGIETVTYMLSGSVKHEDSLGNKGEIESGDLQWMNAGSGIIHQEMPQNFKGKLRGFQLWVNLPSSHKMSKPGYQEIKSSEIPQIQWSDGVNIKIIAGKVKGETGPVKDIMVNPLYLDISMKPKRILELPICAKDTVFAYLIEGQGYFDEFGRQEVFENQLVLFEHGNRIMIQSDEIDIRFLLVGGTPLRETIAWAGPIVMNTQNEIELAFREYEEGTFIK